LPPHATEQIRSTVKSADNIHRINVAYVIVESQCSWHPENAVQAPRQQCDWSRGHCHAQRENQEFTLNFFHLLLNLSSSTPHLDCRLGYGRQEMFAEIAGIYRASKKKKDINWFTEWVARPPAAIVVWALAKTRITPNQVTFLSAIICAIAGAMLVLLPGRWWLLAAAAVYEFSFILDCADGQLARHRKIASPLGHQLDFLMDELKAMLVFGCVAVRLWQWGGPGVPDQLGTEGMLLIGIAGLFCLASGIALTGFMRRVEYGGPPPTEDGQPAQVGTRTGPVGLVLNAIEFAARIVVHYPQYIWICAIFNRIDIYFWAYAAVNALYLLKSLAAIMLRLGRFAPRA
jgi:CDP-alcohol phosphatidyltransferase